MQITKWWERADPSAEIVLRYECWVHWLVSWQSGRFVASENLS
jgi:hypothetical protein